MGCHESPKPRESGDVERNRLFPFRRVVARYRRQELRESPRFARGCPQTFIARYSAHSERLEAKTGVIMKLNSTQLKKALSQFEAEVLPDSHPAVPQLHSLFGDHTFFIDDSGLNVLEPAEKLETEVRTGEVVSLASWSDATLTTLRPHEPEPTGLVIVLETGH
jgi:hypothetical protein